tara:strand:- start:251 stop:436 length:186 start_codon:yes stop_codon:yes gene_type:complete
MKTIKIIVEGGVVQNVTIPKEYSKFLNVEVVDYDKIDAEEEDNKRRDYESKRSERNYRLIY